VRQFTVSDGDDRERGWPGTSRREWLYMHPPSSVSVEVAIPPHEQTWLQASVTLDPVVWESETGDGVRFVATVTPTQGAVAAGPTTVVDREVNPRAHLEDRKWVPVEADLSRWGGQVVRLTLQTLPRDDLTYDWAGWANPVVATRDTARERLPSGAFNPR
jgi:hypothetical protein